MYKDVVDVKPLGGHKLAVRFADGKQGEVDLAEMVSFAGVWAPLRDPQYFIQVKISDELGCLYWPNGADICPDLLYSRATGAALPGLEEAREYPRTGS